MTQTTTQRLASLLLGQPVDQWVRDRREAGDSWRRIAMQLHEITDGQVSLTGEAIRLWVKDAA